MAKYKKLRNQENSQLRKEIITHNNERVKSAKNENDIRKIVKEVSYPRKECNWSLKLDDGSVTNDEKLIAETFNNYFVTKITILKDSIDPSYVEDLLSRLKQ